MAFTIQLTLETMAVIISAVVMAPLAIAVLWSLIRKPNVRVSDAEVRTECFMLELLAHQ